MLQKLCLFFLGITWSCGLLAQQSPPAYFQFSTESGDVFSLDEMRTKKGIVGMSMVILSDDAPDTSIYSGNQDVTGKVLVQPSTIYQMGSLGMSMVHFAVLKAATDGRLDLDMPVNDYLRSWKLPKKGWMKNDPVTVRDVLLHKRRYSLGYKPDGQLQGTELPTLANILRGKSPATNPALKVTGRKNKNGNSSYAVGMICQQLLEDIYRESIAQVMKEEVMDPLGMVDSYWGIAPTGTARNRVAAGYEQDGTPVPNGFLVYPEQASAGFWSSPRDYAKLVRHIYAAAKGAEGSMIDQEMAQQSIEPQVGQRSLIYNKANDLFWGGAPRGYYCMFNGKAEKGIVILVFMNSNLNWQFCNQVMSEAWRYVRQDLK